MNVDGNYIPVIDNLEKVLGSWYNRSLSLSGKILVLNTLGESLFVYKLTVLPNMSETLCKHVDAIVNNYLWAGKRSKIRKKNPMCKQIQCRPETFQFAEKTKSIENRLDSKN